MEVDDVEAHFQSLCKVYKKLDSLVDSSNPLTPNDIFTSTLINSLPDDWVHVVTPLLQHSSVDSATVIRAIQSESTRRKSTTLSSGADPVAAKANLSRQSDKSKSNQKAPYNSSSYNNNYTNSTNSCGHDSKYCMYCKRLNHNMESFWELEDVVKERDQKEK